MPSGSKEPSRPACGDNASRIRKHGAQLGLRESAFPHARLKMWNEGQRPVPPLRRIGSGISVLPEKLTSFTPRASGSGLDSGFARILADA